MSCDSGNECARATRQHFITRWASLAFGEEEMTPRVRALRLLEEALELAQAEGVDADTAAKVAARVFSRPVGEARLEAGGVGVCLLAYCEVRGWSASELEQAEVQRITGKPFEFWRERAAKKRAEGLL